MFIRARHAIILAVAALTMAAPAAGADHVPAAGPPVRAAAPGASDELVARALLVANTVWHHPCAARGRVTLTTWYVFEPHVLAKATQLTCEIRLNQATTEGIDRWRMLCPVLIHEVGHLAGYRDHRNKGDEDHSHNRRSVMHKWYHYDRRCDRRGRPYLRAHGAL